MRLIMMFINKRFVKNIFCNKLIKLVDLNLSSMLKVPNFFVLAHLNDFCSFLKRNIEMILNSIATKKYLSLTDGINRKINVLRAMAYGYKSMN